LFPWLCYDAGLSFKVQNMRVVSSFVGFVLAIAISIFIFAPDRLPVGYGFKPVPVELVVENTLAGQLVESVTGKSAKSLVLTNTSSEPIYNLTLTLKDENGQIKHQHVTQLLPAAQEVTLGWAKKWSVEEGDQLEVKASAYYQVVWAL
jgi:hypothetical protein